MDAKETRDQIVRDAKSSLILDAALKVFAEKGFHETHLEDIAAEAGFSKASLYNYYEDKEAIFLQILIRLHERILETLKKEIRSDRHIKDNIAAMARAIFTIYDENFSFSMSLSDLRSMSPTSLDKFRKHHEPLMARFSQYSKDLTDFSVSVFAAGRNRGEITSAIDDKTLALYVTWIMRGILCECKASGKISDVETNIKNIMDFLEHGMGFAKFPE
jgi:AcrR family transcriptional regulator